MKNKSIILFAVSLLFVACKSGKSSVHPQNVVNTLKMDTEVNAGSINTEYMDKTVKPQEDFFQFSNGTWIKNNPVPESESRWGSFNELDKQNKIVLKSILTKLAANPSLKGSNHQILGDYFSSFINSSQRDAQGDNALKERLKKVNELRSRDDFSKLLGEMTKVGINGFISLGVSQNQKKVNEHITYCGPGSLGLPNRDYYTDENKKEIREKYVIHLQKCFEKIGNSAENSIKMSEKVMDIESELALARLTKSEARLPEKTFNPRSMVDLKKSLSNLDVESYLKRSGSQNFDSLIVSEPAYLIRANELLLQKDIDSWKAFFTWCVVREYAGKLSKTWEELNFDFYGKVLSGKMQMKPKEEQAIDDITNSAISEALGKAFVETSFSVEAKNKVNKMVDNLLAVFQVRIQNLTWMSEPTKIQALKKLNAIGRKLGFPNKWKDFSMIDISNKDLVQNSDNLNAYAIKDNFDRLYKEVDKDEWEMPAHLVNAYYHPLMNEIAFPAGIMQPPFFSLSYEDAVNYGRIGMVIGHEFTHGFDDNGAKFAYDGTYTDWWAEEDKQLFKERTQTLGETYASFCPFSDHCVNPDLTMGENIADLGGLTMAYYAYAMTDEFKSGLKINGYTPAQRFFISYAQLWKINYKDEELKNRIATDYHSPGMYRVNGPLKNCPEFFEAFEVKEGDKMRNPTFKLAKIW